MCRGKGSDFEMTEGEVILKMRNETSLREGKIKIWGEKQKKKGQDEREKKRIIQPKTG